MGLFWDLGSDILVIGAVILYGINSIANTLMQSEYPHYDLFAPKRVIPGCLISIRVCGYWTS